MLELKCKIKCFFLIVPLFLLQCVIKDIIINYSETLLGPMQKLSTSRLLICSDVKYKHRINIKKKKIQFVRIPLFYTLWYYLKWWKHAKYVTNWNCDVIFVVNNINIMGPPIIIKYEGEQLLYRELWLTGGGYLIYLNFKNGAYLTFVGDFHPHTPLTHVMDDS